VLDAPHAPSMDVFSLGVVLFIMLVGRKPFNIADSESLAYVHLELAKAPGLRDQRCGTRRGRGSSQHRNFSCAQNGFYMCWPVDRHMQVGQAGEHLGCTAVGCGWGSGGRRRGLTHSRPVRARGRLAPPARRRTPYPPNPTASRGAGGAGAQVGGPVGAGQGPAAEDAGLRPRQAHHRQAGARPNSPTLLLTLPYP